MYFYRTGLEYMTLFDDKNAFFEHRNNRLQGNHWLLRMNVVLRSMSTSDLKL